jgi:hypothetical protein
MASILKVDTIQDQSGNNIINESADTITIGASGDTISIPAGATLTNSGTATGFGKVLQVVQASTTTSTTIASTSYVDTTLTASITPTSASNKILVITSQACLAVNGANASVNFNTKLLRVSTQLEEKNGEINCGVGANGFAVENFEASFVFLDSPNTTSSTTYKTQAKASSTANSMSLRFQSGSQPSTITLMEIEG